VKLALKLGLWALVGMAAFSPPRFLMSIYAQEGSRVENLATKDGSAKLERALKSEDSKDRGRQQPCKVFTVELENGRGYRIDMTSKEIDSYLRLEDPAGKELAKDDDSGGLLNARINFQCRTAGAYRIVCTTFGGGTGSFVLTVREIANAKAVALNLKDGVATIDGTLAGSDATDAVRTASASKTFTIRLAKGKSYRIDMRSKDVDPYLRIEDSAGKELAHDDDSGGDRNARIEFACPEAGEYRILATTYRGGTGRFTLTVNEK
jgi:hypothetical protein